MAPLTSVPLQQNVAFAAVPYVRVQRAVDLGPWRLWPNTKVAWEREAGVDLSWFMEMYRGRDGKPVQDAGSVLTRTGAASASREQFRDAITAFSTLAWLDGHPSADAWLFEVWSVPKNATRDDGFRRVGKFFSNHTSPEHDPVYPSPYVFPIQLRPDLPRMVTDFVEAELLNPNDGAVLRALGQLHAARFDTPYFTSLGNDIESLWTGFEALWLPETPPGTAATTPVIAAPAVAAANVAALPVATPAVAAPGVRHPRRSERLSTAICSELGAVPGIRAESLSGISTFVEKLWSARNAHSHAGHVEPPIRLEAVDSTALSVGLRLFELVLKIRIASRAGDDVFLLPTVVDRLNEIFVREHTIKELVDILGKLKAADWYPPRPEHADQRARLRPLLVDLIAFSNVDGWAGQREVAKARGFFRRVLNMWMADLTKIPQTGDDVSQLAQFPSVDAEILRELKGRGLAGAELEDALDQQLVEYVTATDVWRAPAMTPTAPPLGGVLQLWLWIRAYIRFQELFIGYELV